MQCRRPGFDPWVEKIPWRRAWPHSCILAWRIPWAEKPDGLQSIATVLRSFIIKRRNLMGPKLDGIPRSGKIFFSFSFFFNKETTWREKRKKFMEDVA